jgi:hypothetical protein
VIGWQAVADALAEVEARIASAGGRDVAVVAVTKGFGADAVEAALAAGCTRIGENYAQELLAKRAALAAAEVHFIGRLQSNKVRSLAGVVQVYESVDRLSVVHELARRDPGARILVQVNATGETGKGGCAPADTESLVGHAIDSGLDVRGLMTVGPTFGAPADARPAFRTVRALADRLGLAECSMGMTADLEVAVEEGSTEVRVGTALFGPRAA